MNGKMRCLDGESAHLLEIAVSRALRGAERRRSLLSRARVAALVLALVPPAAVTTGCGLGCDYALAVEPVSIEGRGAPRVDLGLAARLTEDGDPVPGVKIEFTTLGPVGVKLGYVTTDAEGVARLVMDEGVGPESLNGENADQWTEYQAKVFPFQTEDGAGDAVCADPATAPFRFKP